LKLVGTNKVVSGIALDYSYATYTSGNVHRQITSTQNILFSYKFGITCTANTQARSQGFD